VPFRNCFFKIGFSSPFELSLSIIIFVINLIAGYLSTCFH